MITWFMNCMTRLPDNFASIYVIWLLCSSDFWPASLHWMLYRCMLFVRQSSLFSLSALKLQVNLSSCGPKCTIATDQTQVCWAWLGKHGLDPIGSLPLYGWSRLQWCFTGMEWGRCWRRSVGHGGSDWLEVRKLKSHVWTHNTSIHSIMGGWID